MKYKLLSIFCISLVLLFILNKTISTKSKYSRAEIDDERIIELVKEIADFMDSGEKISSEIACREPDGYNDYYFEHEEDEEKLYIYHREYIKDEAYDYLCSMYDIRSYRGRLAQSRSSESELNDYRGYKIYTEGEFHIKNRDAESICVQIQFKKLGNLSDDMPKISDGEIYFELCEDNKWRISKVSQWYNDLAYYDLGYKMKVFFVPEYSLLSEYEEFIKEYGYDSKGNRISMYIGEDINDEILSGSDSEIISEFTNLEKLKKLSKLAAYIAREEIYARHGKAYPEKSMEYNYFRTVSWYEENENFSEEDLSDIEKENIKAISEYIDGF